MRTGRRAAWLATAAIAAVALGLTACEPTPPAPTFEVEGDGAIDAQPGDGICADQWGTCTLQAAIGEANALGRATILFPDYLEGGTVPAITGAITLRPSASVGRVGLGSTTLVVAAGGHLDLARFQPDSGSAWTGPGRLDLEVSGSLQVRDSYVTSLTVEPGGSALLLQSTVRTHPDYRQDSVGLVNDGTVLLWFSRTLAPIATGTGATTTATASWIQAGCSGSPITSGGHNAGMTTACGPRAATDIAPGVDLGFDVLEGQWDYGLYGNSPLLDAVPEGVAGCGESATFAPTPRIAAADSDRDGTPGCEIGPRQVGEIPEGSIG